jgi:hypothetical protein
MRGALQTQVQKNRETNAGIDLSPRPTMFEITSSSNYSGLLEHMPWVSLVDVVKH